MMWSSGNFYAINGITHYRELCFQTVCVCTCVVSEERREKERVFAFFLLAGHILCAWWFGAKFMTLSWFLNDCEIEIGPNESIRTPHNHIAFLRSDPLCLLIQGLGARLLYTFKFLQKSDVGILLWVSLSDIRFIWFHAIPYIILMHHTGYIWNEMYCGFKFCSNPCNNMFSHLTWSAFSFLLFSTVF